MYLDYMVAENIHFHTNFVHRETLPLEDITFFCGCLACGSRLMYPYLLKRVTRQLRNIQLILIEPSEPAPPAMTQRDMDSMFDDCLLHLVRYEPWSTRDPNDLRDVHDYIR